MKFGLAFVADNFDLIIYLIDIVDEKNREFLSDCSKT